MDNSASDSSADQLTRLALFEDVILGLVLASTLLLFTTHLNSHFTLPKLTMFAVLLVPMLVSMLLRIRAGAYQVLPSIVWLPLLLLATWWLFGTSQSMHVSTALEGQYGRYNGLYANLLLVMLFVNVASIPFDTARLHRLMAVLFTMVLLVCSYAFIQYLGFDIIFDKLQSGRPFASIGNPVALATVLVLVIPYILAGLVLRDGMWLRVSLGVLLLICLVALVLSKSRGPVMALLAALMIGGLLLTIYSQRLTRKSRIWVIAAIASLLIVFSVVCQFGLCDKLFQGKAIGMRLVYFQVALEMIPASPLTGFGFESFRLLYPLYRPLDDYTYGETVVTPTMIHNDYLQLAVDNGLPAMLFYLVFTGAIAWWLFKAIVRDPQRRVVHVAGLMMLTAFLVQGMSGWLEISSSIIFWLLLGISVSLALQGAGEGEGVPRPPVSRYGYLVVTAAGMLAALFISGVMLQKVKADYWLGQAQYYSKAIFRKTDRYIDKIDQVARDDYYYQDQAGYLYFQHLKKNPSNITYLKGRKYFLRARKLNPYELYARFHNISLDSLALHLRLIKQPSSEAMEDMREILRLDPNSPTVYEVRARLHHAIGATNAARQDYMKYLELSNQSR